MGNRKKRTRPTAKPQLLMELEAARDRQDIDLNRFVTDVVKAIARQDAQSAAFILEAANPLDRYSRITGVLAKHLSKSSFDSVSVDKALTAIDDFRDVLKPRAKYATQEQLNKAFAKPRLTKNLGSWSLNQKSKTATD
jgi:hypothetical protein